MQRIRIVLYAAVLMLAMSVASCGGGGGSAGGGSIDTTAPSVPTGLAVNVLSSTQLYLSWNASTDDTGVADYAIYRNGSLLKSVTTTVTFDTSLTPATQYCYAVGARDAANNVSQLSSQVCATTLSGTAVDTVAPLVNSVYPTVGGGAIPVNERVMVAFTEKMDCSTITADTFLVSQGTTTVAGSIWCGNETAIFTPDADLASSTTYTVSVTAGAKDVAGNALGSAVTWSFTTGSTSDTSGPTASVYPSPGATNVYLRSTVILWFSEPVDPATVNSSTFKVAEQGSFSWTTMPGSISVQGRAAKFSPSAGLASSTTYSVSVTDGVKDLAGNALTPSLQWTFTTTYITEGTPPDVMTAIPSGNATTSAANPIITAMFDENIDPFSISTLSFMLMDANNNPVPGAIEVNGSSANFKPFAPLTPGSAYTALVKRSVQDLRANSMLSDYSWSFTPD